MNKLKTALSFVLAVILFVSLSSDSLASPEDEQYDEWQQWIENLESSRYMSISVDVFRYGFRKRNACGIEYTEPTFAEYRHAEAVYGAAHDGKPGLIRLEVWANKGIKPPDTDREPDLTLTFVDGVVVEVMGDEYEAYSLDPTDLDGLGDNRLVLSPHCLTGNLLWIWVGQREQTAQVAHYATLLDRKWIKPVPAKEGAAYEFRGETSMGEMISTYFLQDGILRERETVEVIDPTLRKEAWGPDLIVGVSTYKEIIFSDTLPQELSQSELQRLRLEGEELSKDVVTDK